MAREIMTSGGCDDLAFYQPSVGQLLSRSVARDQRGYTRQNVVATAVSQQIQALQQLGTKRIWSVGARPAADQNLRHDGYLLVTADLRHDAKVAADEQAAEAIVEALWGQRDILRLV